MTQIAKTGFDTAGFEEFLQLRDEPDWLIDMRREAWQHSEAMQWPDRREEEWIRTDIRTFQINKFGLPAINATVVPEVHQLRSGVDLAGSIEILQGIIETLKIRVGDEFIPIVDEGFPPGYKVSLFASTRGVE